MHFSFIKFFTSGNNTAAITDPSPPPLTTGKARQTRQEAVAKSYGNWLHELARRPQNELLTSLNTTTDGITHHEATVRRETHGKNVIAADKAQRWWYKLWSAYYTPFNLLLSALSLTSFLTDDMKSTIVIGSMVVIATLMRFVQDIRSTQAMHELSRLVCNMATVIRPDTGCMEVAVSELVPGDIIKLSAGDQIPADARLISAKNLCINQATLTGEAHPAEKLARIPASTIQNPFDLDNMVFMGTSVISGSAIAVIVSTGDITWLGAIAKKITTHDAAPTAFQMGVNKVSWLLIRFMLVMVPTVMLINGLTKGNWMDAALFALSVAVGLTPEMLPMIVTSSLARGAIILARQKVITRHLDAIQNFGAMDILCTDKTGTLTEDHIVLASHTDAFGLSNDETLRLAAVNSHYQTGLKNSLDNAVLQAAAQMEQRIDFTEFYKTDEIPFDFNRRRMSVIVEKSGQQQLICKGALEEILSACTLVKRDDSIEALNAKTLRQIRTLTDSYSQKGWRTLAVATCQFTINPHDMEFGVADESRMTLMGLLTFFDPPKTSSAAAIKALQSGGVDVKVLTGDNERITLHVCQSIGLPVKNVLLGADIAEMSDADLAAAAKHTTVFARLTPTDKERIVQVLRDAKHVVGFLGDGINDAPALRAADIGISVNTAADIARDSADLVLLEKDLGVLETGMREGRRTFANMLKYIKLTASSNFGNVFSVLAASAFIPFIPMLPLQMLLQNMLYDISQTVMPFDNVDAETLKKPSKWNPRELGWFMVFFGPISSIFDIVMFVLLWFGFGANSSARATLFHSGWFVEGLLSQTLIVHMLRTRKIPFLQSTAAKPLLIMAGLVTVIGLVLPMSPFAGYFGLQALPMIYFPCLLTVLVAYAALTQGLKDFYARRFGWC